MQKDQITAILESEGLKLSDLLNNTNSIVSAYYIKDFSETFADITIEMFYEKDEGYKPLFSYFRIDKHYETDRPVDFLSINISKKELAIYLNKLTNEMVEQYVE